MLLLFGRQVLVLLRVLARQLARQLLPTAVGPFRGSGSGSGSGSRCYHSGSLLMRAARMHAKIRPG